MPVHDSQFAHGDRPEKSIVNQPSAQNLSPAAAPLLGVEGRILEGIVTTLNEDGSTNISPMGPIVGESFDRLWLRPFQTSTTYRNLKREGAGVFHLTDDVELFAQAAIGQPEPLPTLMSGRPPQSAVLANVCRWFAFEVESLDDSAERTSIVVRVTERGVLREFLGFNRAKHAVIEAAILATRVHLLPPEEIHAEFSRLQTIVEKTGAAPEHRALALLAKYVQRPSPSRAGRG
jgi:hypothetical protein